MGCHQEEFRFSVKLCAYWFGSSVPLRDEPLWFVFYALLVTDKT